jgi:hypothetical protein
MSLLQSQENMSYEFLFTSEDRSKSTSLWLGSGMKMPATRLPKLKYFEGMKMMNMMMKMNGDLDDMGMHMSNQTMDMNEVMYPEVSGEMESKKKNKEGHDMHHMNMDDTEMNNMPEMEGMSIGLLI